MSFERIGLSIVAFSRLRQQTTTANPVLEGRYSLSATRFTWRASRILRPSASVRGEKPTTFLVQVSPLSEVDCIANSTRDAVHITAR